MAPKPAKRTRQKAPPTLIVYGNAQARAIAHVIEGMPQITQRYEVRYVDSAAVARNDLPLSAVLLDQHSDGSSDRGTTAIAGKVVRFPLLTLNLLWPFNCPNPANVPAPPAYPFGPFPNGDSFLLSCVKQNVAPSDAVKLYLSPSWAPSWPDLDQHFRQESARLIAADASNDVQIGSYILKHFRKQRLFLGPAAPADILLSELIHRLLATAFSGDAAIADANVPGIIASFGHRDFLGTFALPVHPLVAQHFQIEWFEPEARYNYFDREQLTGRAYYERFLAYAVKHHGG